MTRRLLTLIFTALMLAMAPAVAQNLKFDIVKFELNQLDGTASNKNYEKIDGSGNKYAIIKVRSTDGKESGKTPCNVNDVLVGNRKVTLSLAGYATASTSIEVKEGEVADVNLTLNSATSTSNTISQVLPNAELEGMYNKGKEAYDNKNYSEAVKYFRKAAEQGYAKAQNYLGVCYYNGEGVATDFSEAVKWYKKAAEQGYASAQYNLGISYYWGYGVEKNYAEAVKWYKKAAEQGYASAQYNLGNCYYWGDGVTKDTDEAVKWFKKAAEQGNASAQSNLGYCYRFGLGVEKNLTEAAKWYKKAAEQGTGLAQLRLAEMYEKGEGVDRDIAEAVKWYKKAAEQGNEDAKSALKRLQ